MLCFGINNVKAQSFKIDYYGYSLEYYVLSNSTNKVAVSCPEDPEEDEIELIIPSTVVNDEGIEFIVTTISEGGFEEKTQFISVTFPNTLTTIEDGAFKDCTGITGELILDGIIQKLGLEAFSGCDGITSLTISSTKLKRIGDQCFSECKNLENVNFISPITTIGFRSFYRCALKKLQFPKTLTTINNYAFERNAPLTEVILNNKINSIGERAFYRCNNLITIICYSTDVPELASNDALGALYSQYNINPNLTIYVPTTSLDEYESAEYWKEYETYDEKDRIVGMPTFVSDGYWDDESNWEPQEIPANNAEVFINADAIINSNVIAHVNSYGIYDGSITIEEGGQLIHNGSEDVVTVKKSIAPYVIGEDGYLESGWYTISSPFGDLQLSSSNFIKNNYELFRYNESIYEWENHKNPEHANDFTTLEAGRGYIYANATATNISITEKLNTENKSHKMTASGEYLKGFNLIGNPFMHNIYKGSGCAIDNVNLAEGFYTLSNEGAWHAKHNEAIKPMESILVKTTAATTLNIKKTTKSSAARALNNGLVTINVSNEKHNDVAYVTFNGGIGLDKINHRNSSIPMVYVPVDNVNYAIAVMDKEVTEIPVNFEATTMGEYTISVSSTACNYDEITLIDKQTGEETNMLAGDYKFLATTNDNPERFLIKVSINENIEAEFFTDGSNIIINNIEGSGVVQIYDVMGRLVIKESTNDSNCQISSAAMANGVYVISLTDDNGTTTKKILINNK